MIRLAKVSYKETLSGPNRLWGRNVRFGKRVESATKLVISPVWRGINTTGSPDRPKATGSENKCIVNEASNQALASLNLPVEIGGVGKIRGCRPTLA